MGKGSVDFWAAKVKPGRIMFEIDGVNEDVTHEALRLEIYQPIVGLAQVVRSTHPGGCWNF